MIGVEQNGRLIEVQSAIGMRQHLVPERGQILWIQPRIGVANGHQQVVRVDLPVGDQLRFDLTRRSPTLASRGAGPRAIVAVRRAVRPRIHTNATASNPRTRPGNSQAASARGLTPMRARSTPPMPVPAAALPELVWAWGQDRQE